MTLLPGDAAVGAGERVPVGRQDHVECVYFQ